MIDKDLFFDNLRKSGLFGDRLSPEEFAGVNAIFDAAIAANFKLSWLAYALATAYHETNRTMQPVKEAYWLSEDWRMRNLSYSPYYGRGFVQLTWLNNYKRASVLCGVDFVKEPDKVLTIEYSAKIMIDGMLNGWFTNYNLPNRLPDIIATIEQFESARKIINGVDKKHSIAIIANNFQDILLKSKVALKETPIIMDLSQTNIIEDKPNG